MRAPLLLIAFLSLAPGFAGAQQPLTRDPAGEPRRNQKIERIVHEDAGARIDELRVGGEAQAVTVQPKGNMPAYEMPPSDLARTRPADQRDTDTGRQRVWNVLSF